MSKELSKIENDAQLFEHPEFGLTTEQRGTTIKIHFTLPRQFTMREYNYIIDLTLADELHMTKDEYLLFENERARKELLMRVRKDFIPNTKLIN